MLLGVNDDGSVAGLDNTAVRRLNQLLGNAASQHVRPPVHPLTENVATGQGIVIVVEVPDGLAKPYLDHQGRIWVKQGSDKRHVTSREEMQRMFQRSGLVYADVVPVEGTSVEDIDDRAFSAYFNRRYEESSEYAGLTREQLLQNLGLGDGRELNLAGLMLFGRNPQRWRPEAEWGVTGEVTPPVTPPVEQLLVMLAEEGPLSSAELRERLQLKDRTHFREHYTAPALEHGLIEYTIPDKPNSRLQRYRLTETGKALAQWGTE